MSIDEAQSAFNRLVEEWKSNSHLIETEQDTRFQVIDRFLTEILGWAHGDVKTERHSKSGFADYLLTIGQRNVLVIEAKRVGRVLIDTRNPKLGKYKLSGPALKSAQDGIGQAHRYAFDHGVTVASVTSGLEWIAFFAVRGDGRSPGEGVAIVFPGWDSIAQHFAIFYDLFSREGIQEQLHKIRLREAEGHSVRHTRHLQAIVEPNQIKLLSKSPMGADLDQIFREFFSTMSGLDDPEMLAKCFVESRESKEADAALEKITGNLINRIEVVHSLQGEELAKHIEAALETGKGEFVLVVGNKGAGKSTFVDRFFRLVLVRSLRERCLLARIDLADSPGDVATVAQWLVERLKRELERDLFRGGTATFDELQGIFWREYSRWRDGEFKFLYETDKDQFKIRFGEHIYQLIERDAGNYVLRLLEHATRARTLLPCIIFDNADHFPQSFQEAVFQYAQSVFRSVLSFVICPVTDRTMWQLSKQGPLQSYVTTPFYLPVPSTKDVLRKRIDYIKLKLEEEGNRSREYFTKKGIRLSIGDIKGFAVAIEDILVNTEYVGRLIGWLSNHDIRRGLQIAQRIITSSIVGIDDLVKTYITGRRTFLKERKIKQALIQGDYNGFRQEDSNYILDMFSVPADLTTSPLGKLSLVRLLADKDAQASSADAAYSTVEEIVNYVEPMGMSGEATAAFLREFMHYGLVEPYDPTDRAVYLDQRIHLSHSGRIHMELATEDETYLTQMSLYTPIADAGLVTRARDRYYASGKLTRSDWVNLRNGFVKYCLDEDQLYVTVPTSYSYQGQKDIRQRFKMRWT